VFEVKSVII